MKKPLLVITLLIAVIYACNQNKPARPSFLHTGTLPVQLFHVDNTKDTTLLTEKGALIHIPKGALKANSANVQLEVKEAYTMQEIVLAGLTTQSNGQPLSSGGMIYINAVEKDKVTITNAISVALPASYLQPGMKLFKGEIQKDSQINWQQPVPLQGNKQLSVIDKGKALFVNNCAVCHAIGRELTGPSLAHADRLAWEEGNTLAEFIRNPAAVMAESPYYRCLKDRYGGVVMTPFPDLTDDDIRNIMFYIGNESKRLHLPVPPNWFEVCHDSCFRYQQAINGIYAKRDSLIDHNGVDGPQSLVETNGLMRGALDSCINCPPVKVIPESFPAVYYQFRIDAFGWYNIDQVIQKVPEMREGRLTVSVTGNSTAAFNIFLVVPAIKLYQEGGLLNGETEVYGFDAADGRTWLLPGAKAFIFALGEGKDEILFGQLSTTLQLQQDLELELKKVTREEFDKAIANMGLDNMSISVKETKNAAAIRQTDKELSEAEKLKPVNCNCDCLKSDSLPVAHK